MGPVGLEVVRVQDMGGLGRGNYYTPAYYEATGPSGSASLQDAAGERQSGLMCVARGSEMEKEVNFHKEFFVLFQTKTGFSNYTES